MLEGIDVLIVDHAGNRRTLILNLTDLRKHILSLFSPQVRIIYNLTE